MSGTCGVHGRSIRVTSSAGRVAVVLAWQVTRCAIRLKRAGIGCRRIVPGPLCRGVHGRMADGICARERSVRTVGFSADGHGRARRHRVSGSAGAAGWVRLGRVNSPDEGGPGGRCAGDAVWLVSGLPGGSVRHSRPGAPRTVQLGRCRACRVPVLQQLAEEQSPCRISAIGRGVLPECLLHTEHGIPSRPAGSPGGVSRKSES
jgi:hypothetical protein